MQQATWAETFLYRARKAHRAFRQYHLASFSVDRICDENEFETVSSNDMHSSERCPTQNPLVIDQTLVLNTKIPDG
jgi:hypothetical protein